MSVSFNEEDVCGFKGVNSEQTSLQSCSSWLLISAQLTVFIAILLIFYVLMLNRGFIVEFALTCINVQSKNATWMCVSVFLSTSLKTLSEQTAQVSTLIRAFKDNWHIKYDWIICSNDFINAQFYMILWLWTCICTPVIWVMAVCHQLQRRVEEVRWRWRVVRVKLHTFT